MENPNINEQEGKIFAPGKYITRITYARANGQIESLDIDFNVSKNSSSVELEEKARSWIGSIGMHNYDLKYQTTEEDLRGSWLSVEIFAEADRDVKHSFNCFVKGNGNIIN